MILTPNQRTALRIWNACIGHRANIDQQVAPRRHNIIAQSHQTFMRQKIRLNLILVMTKGKADTATRLPLLVNWRGAEAIFNRPKISMERLAHHAVAPRNCGLHRRVEASERCWVAQAFEQRGLTKPAVVDDAVGHGGIIIGEPVAKRRCERNEKSLPCEARLGLVSHGRQT